jgi:hypothetical protein
MGPFDLDAPGAFAPHAHNPSSNVKIRRNVMILFILRFPPQIHFLKIYLPLFYITPRKCKTIGEEEPYKNFNHLDKKANNENLES